MHRTGLLGVLLLILSAMPHIAVSQELAEQAATPQENQSTEPPRRIEEINVTAERSLLVIRNQIEREEEALYRLFNDLNSADKYDILCEPDDRFLPLVGVPVEALLPKPVHQVFPVRYDERDGIRIMVVV